MDPTSLVLLALVFLGFSAAAAAGTTKMALKAGARRPLAILLGIPVAFLVFIALFVVLYSTYNGRLPGIC